MRVAIVGFEVEGKSAFTYWHNLGADITICDHDPDKVTPTGTAIQLGPDYLNGLNRFDIIVRSAGIHPEILLSANPDIKNKITTVIDEFLRVCPTKNVIGVTGTKGKGTTSTLISRMLEGAGEHVLWGGNIGVSPLDFVSKVTPDSWIVLELSSFQLSDVRHSPHIGVCLMVVPEHLNWHQDMDEYILAKAHMFEYQTTADTAIYFAENDISRKIAAYSPGLKIPYFAKPGAYVENNAITIAGETVCQVDELKLLGKHNWQNACAAVTVLWQITQNIQALRLVLTTFSGLEHRLEFVREVNGIKYYNDSYASTPDAAMAAMAAIPGTKVMIMGGFDRKLPLEHLAQAISAGTKGIRKIILIGASGPRLGAELDTVGFTNYVIDSSKNISDIVAKARSLANEQDSVVLSPGFSSFDMFKNFTDRGLQFKAAVGQL